MGRINLHFQRTQKPSCHCQVDGIVVHHQYFGIRSYKIEILRIKPIVTRFRLFSVEDTRKPQDIQGLFDDADIPQSVRTHLAVIRQHHAGDIRVGFQKCLNRIGHKRMFHEQILYLLYLLWVHPGQIPIGGKPLVIYSQPLHIRLYLLCGIITGQKSQCLHCFLDRPDTGNRTYNILGNDKGESASLAVLTFHPDLAMHERNQLFTDRQSQTASLDVPIALAVQLLEGLEEFVSVTLPDAASGIGYRNEEVQLTRPFGPIAYLQMHIPHLCKLDGIVRQIDDDLFDADIVAPQLTGNVRVHIHCQFQFLAANPRHDNVCHIIDYGHGLIFRLIDGHHAGFYLGKIQNVIDDCQ